MTDRPARRIAVLVSGSGSNLAALAEAIDADPDFGGEIVVVATDQPGCRGIERAGERGLPTVAVALEDHPDRAAWEKTLADEVADHDPDLVLLAGFMRILSGGFLARWPDRILNVHPSLLPSFPGAHAVRDALEHGVKVTGTTVHVVREEVDHGPIVAQRAVDVHGDDDEATLHERIKAEEHTLVPAAVKLACHDRIELDGRRVRIRAASRPTALTTLDVGTEGAQG